MSRPPRWTACSEISSRPGETCGFSFVLQETSTRRTTSLVSFRDGDRARGEPFYPYSAAVAMRVPCPYPWLMDVIAKGWGYVFSTVIALLPIVNPLSTVGVLLAITAGLSERERIEQTRRACIYMALILISFLIAGGLIMRFFGI